MKKIMLVLLLILLSVSLFGFEYKADKVMHTSCAFMINTSSYIALKYYTEQKPLTIVIESFAITASFGLAKELSDAEISTDDLVADGIGWAVSASCLALLEPFEVYYADKYVMLSYRF